jgi:hypothetical protein
VLDIIGGQQPLLKRDGSPQLDHDGNVIMVRGGTDKDAINAAKLLLSYNLGDPRTAHYEPDPDRSMGSVLPAVYSMGGQVLSEPKVPETPEEMAALKASVQAQIEATIQSVNTRPSRRRKRV